VYFSSKIDTYITILINEAMMISAVHHFEPLVVNSGNLVQAYFIVIYVIIWSALSYTLGYWKNSDILYILVFNWGGWVSCICLFFSSGFISSFPGVNFSTRTRSVDN